MVVVEVIFVYPGMGQLMVDHVAKRDMPVVQAVGMMFATAYILFNVLADTPVAFTVDVESPETVAVASATNQDTNSGAAVINATRLFDDGYNVTLGFNGTKIILSDFIGPGDTNIYEIGCTGPRPRPIAGPSGRTISPPWSPCANRRAICRDHTSQCSGV